MHLWPERVVPKCADDRSLAIAHGLENAFWEEDDDGKWQPLTCPAGRDRPAHRRAHLGGGQRRSQSAAWTLPRPSRAAAAVAASSRRGSTRRARSSRSTAAAGPATPEPATLQAVRRAIAAGDRRCQQVGRPRRHRPDATRSGTPRSTRCSPMALSPRRAQVAAPAIGG